MKLLRRAALGLAVVLAFAAAPRSAQAADTYTILTHGTAPIANGTARAWEASKCSPDVFNSPANGVEARIVDISAYAGRTIRITWNTPATVATTGLSVLWAANTCSAGRVSSVMSAPDWGLARNTMTMFVPAGSRWAVFTAMGAANITFTIS